MKKYIHVNQHKIRSNKKNNSLDPVITIKEGRKNTYCSEVEILGPSRVIYGGNDKSINAGTMYYEVPSTATTGQKDPTKTAVKYAAGLAVNLIKNEIFKYP